MREIPLNPRKLGIVVQIDDEDLDRVAQHSWTLNGRGYAITTLYGPKQTISLHRFVMNARPDEEIDHEDRNKLNCQKYNLRRATRAQNNRNTGKRRDGITSHYKGVHLHRCGKYEAGIRVNRKRIYLGLHNTQEEAAHAYDTAARTHFGIYAVLNFPDVSA